MSISAPHTPSLRLKFISTQGHNGRLANVDGKPQYQHTVQVKSGTDLTSDRYMSATGISGSLATVIMDGDKAFVRSHFIASDETRRLEQILERGLSELDTQKPLSALVIGGNDQSPEARDVFARIKAFFRHKNIDVTALQHKQKPTAYPKGTNLIIKPSGRKVLVSNQDADKSVSANVSLKPIIHDEQSLDDFYTSIEIPTSHTVTFVQKDEPFGKRVSQTN